MKLSMERIPDYFSLIYFKRKVINFKEKEIEVNFGKTNQACERIK